MVSTQGVTRILRQETIVSKLSMFLFILLSPCVLGIVQLNLQTWVFIENVKNITLFEKK